MLRIFSLEDYRYNSPINITKSKNNSSVKAAKQRHSTQSYSKPILFLHFNLIKLLATPAAFSNSIVPKIKIQLPNIFAFRARYQLNKMKKKKNEQCYNQNTRYTKLIKI